MIALARIMPFEEALEKMNTDRTRQAEVRERQDLQERLYRRPAPKTSQPKPDRKKRWAEEHAKRRRKPALSYVFSRKLNNADKTDCRRGGEEGFSWTDNV